MKLPLFDKTIPVSLDKNRPNRYGYASLIDIAEDYSVEIVRYDRSHDSQYDISISAEHSIYTFDNPNDIIYAQLCYNDENLYYVYLSKELQNALRVDVKTTKDYVTSIALDDCYLCVENYMSKDNNVYSRYVIDLYYTSYNGKDMAKDDIEKEISELVTFFKMKGFTHSSQVSKYIRNNKLGKKYRNISGFLEMSNEEGDSWTFEGGIAPQYYKEICHRLNLDNNRTDSFVVGFESYKDHSDE